MTDDPRRLCEAFRLRDGSEAVVRAIRPDDRERLQAAFRELDPESSTCATFLTNTSSALPISTACATPTFMNAA